MAVKIPSQSEITQMISDIDDLEGYSFYEWLDYMQEEYPNVDAVELYTSGGTNIVTGYYDDDNAFIEGEPEVEEPLDADTMRLIQDSVDSREDVPLNVPASEELTQGETTAAFLADLRDRKLNPERYESIMLGRDEGEEEQFTEGAIVEGGMLTDEEIMAEDTPIDSADPMGLGEMIAKYATDAGIDPTLAMVMAGITTKNPRMLTKKTPRITTKNSTILKASDDAASLANRIKGGNIKKKGPSDSTISTKNSTVLKETTPKVSTKNSTVLKETTPKVSTKNSTILKERNVDAITKKANVAKVNSITKNRKLSVNDKVNIAAGTAAAASIAALTNQNGLTGERSSDGSFMTQPTDIHPEDTKDFKTEEDYLAAVKKAKTKDSDMIDDMPPYEKSIDDRDIAPKSTGKPGWTLDGKGGNYLSANFEDDYWNTPDGVEEAIGIWGRPVGNKIGARY
jgi:hypothetical protein